MRAWKALNVRPLGEIDLVHAGPVEDREQVGVGDAEFVALAYCFPSSSFSSVFKRRST